MKKDPTSAAYIPVRIREIIRDTLSPSKWDLSTLPLKPSFQPPAEGEEKSSSSLEKELKEAQEKLSNTEKDCMELSVKYISINEKVNKMLSINLSIIIIVIVAFCTTSCF